MPLHLKSSHRRVFLLQSLLLLLAVTALYGGFLGSPLVFDDIPFFRDTLPKLVRGKISFSLRWLPYASFEWTQLMFGENVVWMRVGNLLVHLVNVGLLLLLLRRLFAAVLPGDDASPTTNAVSGATLSSSWHAFFGALLFAIHPVGVYGVGYLVQRTILLATMFALLTWLLFLEGLLRGRRRWLLASAFAYLLAVLSKEHAIMVPAVSAALLFLLRKPDRRLAIQVGPTFFLYALVGAFIIYMMKTRAVLGAAYEPYSSQLLLERRISADAAYPLSVVSQAFLYFKYLGLWVMPNPAWMSVCMVEEFPMHLWTWPETLGLAGFVGYGALSGWLLFRRGRQGLFGFALLCPWLLFATELSSVRIQEIFVLYRSYLWMPGIFAAIPFLFQRVPAKYAAGSLLVMAFVLAPITWNRLAVFADPVRLWSDALTLAQRHARQDHTGLGGIYYGRGWVNLEQKAFPQAIEDFTDAIKFMPTYGILYNNRALAYLEISRYDLALADLNKAIHLDPEDGRNYLSRSQVYLLLGNQEASQQDYAIGSRLESEKP